jgi:histone-lysine N-methyltransferase SETMAR
MEVQGDLSPPKRQKMLKKKSRTHDEDRRRGIHELADNAGVSYGVCQILTENLNMLALLLHHGNASAHTSQKTTEFVTNNKKVIVPHPPYSPVLAHRDFAFFLKLKTQLKGRRFQTVSDIQRESRAALDNIKENDFHGASEASRKPWNRFISSQGDCFEADGSQN